MAHLSDYNTEKQYRARVLRTTRVTPLEYDEIREIQLEIDDLLFDCKVDQSFGVLVKAPHEFGNTFHHRLYSVADIPEKKNKKTRLTFLVKRCFYVDDFNGERYKGIGSGYLCDRKVGDEIIVTGPHELPFNLPDDKNANIIMIGMGTGIAPFRAFVKHIYHNLKDWKGMVRLYYGAKSGLELLYLNDHDGDLLNYYDEETFKAFSVLSPRAHWSEQITVHQVIEDRAEEILELLNYNNTYIYVAGYKKVLSNMDRAFSHIMGSEIKWFVRKAELIAGHKWAEIIY